MLLLVALRLSLLHRMLGTLLDRWMGLGRRLLLLHGLLGLLVKGIRRGRLHRQIAGIQGNTLEIAEKFENHSRTHHRNCHNYKSSGTFQQSNFFSLSKKESFSHFTPVAENLEENYNFNKHSLPV